MWNRIKQFWRRNKARYLEAVNRYGLPVILTSILLRVVMTALVVLLVKIGWSPESYNAELGLIGGAWVVTWPFAPIRWILAAIIAPPAVRMWRKMRGQDPGLPPPLEDAPAEPKS